MARTLVTLKKGADEAAFEKDLVGAGISFKKIRGLARIYDVYGYAPADFPLRNHPSVASGDDGEQSGVEDVAQGLQFDATMGGANYGLARHIRRDNPWLGHPRGIVRFPVQTFFDSNRDGTGVDYYSVDSGVRESHDEFGGKAVNVASAHPHDFDDSGHGTHTASIAVGKTTGIARGVESIRMFKGTSSDSGTSSGSGTLPQLIEMLGAALQDYNDRAALNRPAVMNYSIGGVASSSAYYDAFEQLAEAGMVICASAGNDSRDVWGTAVTPAMYNTVLTVGGITANDIRYFSGNSGTNTGHAVALLAAGYFVRGAATTGDSDYRLASGTSFSAPHVAGIVACMLQGRSRLTSFQQVKEVMSEVVTNATRGRLLGESRNSQYSGAGYLLDRIAYLDPRPVENTPFGQGKINCVGSTFLNTTGMVAGDYDLSVPGGLLPSDFLLLHVRSGPTAPANLAGWALQGEVQPPAGRSAYYRVYSTQADSGIPLDKITLSKTDGEALIAHLQVFRGPHPIEVAQIAFDFFENDDLPIRALSADGDPTPERLTAVAGMSHTWAFSSPTFVRAPSGFILTTPDVSSSARLTVAWRHLEPGEIILEDVFTQALPDSSDATQAEQQSCTIILADTGANLDLSPVMLSSRFKPDAFALAPDQVSYSNRRRSNYRRFLHARKRLGTKNPDEIVPQVHGYYWEVQITEGTDPHRGYTGVVSDDQAENWTQEDTNPISFSSIGWRGVGEIRYGASSDVDAAPTYSAGDRLMIAFDPYAGHVYVGKNGVWDATPKQDFPSGRGRIRMGVFYPSVQAREVGDAGVLYSRASEFLYPVPPQHIPLSDDLPDPVVDRVRIEIENTPIGYDIRDNMTTWVSTPDVSDYRRWSVGHKVIPSSYSGKVYWESLCIFPDSPTTDMNGYSGVFPADLVDDPIVGRDVDANPVEHPNAVGWRGINAVWMDTSNQNISPGAYGHDDLLMFCFKPSTGELWFGKNGVWHRNPDTQSPSVTVPVYPAGWKPSFQGRDGGSGHNLRSALSQLTYPLPSGAVPYFSDLT